MKGLRALVTILLAFTLLAGCGPKYTCPCPSGMKCTSVSEVYEIALKEGNVKTTEESEKGKREFLRSIEGYYVESEDTDYVIRRILINRWVDGDNVVYGRSYVTIAIPKGVRESGSKLKLLTPQWTGSKFHLPSLKPSSRGKGSSAVPGVPADEKAVSKVLNAIKR